MKMTQTRQKMNVLCVLQVEGRRWIVTGKDENLIVSLWTAPKGAAKEGSILLTQHPWRLRRQREAQSEATDLLLRWALR